MIKHLGLTRDLRPTTIFDTLGWRSAPLRENPKMSDETEMQEVQDALDELLGDVDPCLTSPECSDVADESQQG